MNRIEKINQILSDLENLQKNKQAQQQAYAIGENIAFYKAIKNIFSYLRWLITRAPNISPEKLMEINDLLPVLDEEMHRKLIEMEQKPFPGLITPLVDKITGILKTKEKPTALANLGSGGMEAERQVILKLSSVQSPVYHVFVGIDKSPLARKLAKQNLRSLQPVVEIFEVENLDQDNLDKIIQTRKDKHAVVLCQNDIFQLNNFFKPETFEIMFHSLFLHHLNEDEEQNMISSIRNLSKSILEYDGFKSWFNMIPQTIIGWNDPVFLNAEIFSNLRFPLKKHLLQEFSRNKIAFSKIGYYLLER